MTWTIVEEEQNGGRELRGKRGTGDLQAEDVDLNVWLVVSNSLLYSHCCRLWVWSES